MSLDKAIKSGKEKRKDYRRSGKTDKTCRPHGGCPFCLSNRMHKHNKRQQEKVDDAVYDTADCNHD